MNVRIAGPTSVDLAAFITTVDAECTKNPAGVIVVGGWDDALASEVDKCIDKKVPTVVTDGDLPMSKRLTYLGTNWYNLGYQHGQYQCRYHAEAGLEGRRDRHDLVPRREQLHRRPARACAMRSPRNARTIKVVADEESGTNVEQVAANTAAIIQGHPNLTGMVGFDSEAGPGIVRAVTESGKAGQIIVTSNEAGRDFMNSIKDGTVKMINMEKYETMDFFAVLYLYTFHNDIIRNLGMDQWLQNPLPAIGDSGLIFVTKDNVDTILAATDPAAASIHDAQGPGCSDRRCEPQRSGICLDQQRLEPAAVCRAGLSGPRIGAQGAQCEGAHRRPDLGRSCRLHHHRRCRMHQEPGRRDRRRRLGRCARFRSRQVHRQEGPDRRHRRRPADVEAPHLSRHQLVQSRLPARPVSVPLSRRCRA